MFDEQVMLGQGLVAEATPSTQISLAPHFEQSWGGQDDTGLVLEGGNGFSKKND